MNTKHIKVMADSDFRAGLEANEKAIQQVRDDQRSAIESIHKDISDLRKSISMVLDRIGAQGRPDYKAIWQAAAVVIAIVSLMFTLASNIATKGFEILETKINSVDTKQASAVHELDDKLQREFRLALDTQAKGLEAMNKDSLERKSNVQQQVNQLNDLVMEQIKSELEEARELRSHERRLNESH